MVPLRKEEPCVSWKLMLRPKWVVLPVPRGSLQCCIYPLSWLFPRGSFNLPPPPHFFPALGLPLGTPLVCGSHFALVPIDLGHNSKDNQRLKEVGGLPPPRRRLSKRLSDSGSLQSEAGPQFPPSQATELALVLGETEEAFCLGEAHQSLGSLAFSVPPPPLCWGRWKFWVDKKVKLTLGL